MTTFSYSYAFILRIPILGVGPHLPILFLSKFFFQLGFIELGLNYCLLFQLELSTTMCD